jgi:hypothetical protein
MTDKEIRDNAIRYIGVGYDKYELQRLLDGEEPLDGFHEEPLVRAFIAGANSRNEELDALRKRYEELKDYASDRMMLPRKFLNNE